jgi:hypothetical protein
VKPTIENGFEYRKLHWADLPARPVEDVPSVEAGDATLAPQFSTRRRRRTIAWS